MRSINTHFYIKRFLNKIIDWSFIRLYGLYIFTYKWWLNTKTYNVSKENEQYTQAVKLSNELTLRHEYMKSSTRPGHFDALPVNSVNQTINRKNAIKEFVTTIASVVIHIYVVIYGYEYFTSTSQIDDIIITLNETQHEENERKSDIFWYHANLNIRKYDTVLDMKREYLDVLSQPCIPLTKREASTNFLSQCGNEKDLKIDLTLLYHMMCHLASERTIHNNNINIIIPKFLNITDLRRLNDEYPIGLFEQNNDKLEFIDTYQIPNICVMAISLPAEHINLDHKHFPVEQSIDPNIPEGAFIHTSVRKTSDDNATFYDLNPIIQKSMNEMWKSIPTPGECSILINPEFNQAGAGNYTLSHSHLLLKDKTVFKTVIHNEGDIKFNDIDFSHKHWIPKTQKQNMHIQTALDVLNSKTCWWED